MSNENVALSAAIGITQLQAHQETIELTFGQRVGAFEFERILRGQHQKRRTQGMSDAVHRYLLVAHRFQQRRLRPRRGAVDFVGQYHLRKKWTRLEYKGSDLLL